ncbi:hypothetical protein Sj15T_20000 [Sphingobium sp. TA15]|nr:hypothetical protein Sj15T_20000 [Sphingobium sp. TA15]
MISMVGRHPPPAGKSGLGPIDIQPITACKWQFPVLPVLTYFKYAALRVTENYHFRLALN